MSQWIWKFGDFEIYHSLQLHNKRQQYGYIEPVIWKMYTPDPVVCFRKVFTTEGGVLEVKACGDMSIQIEDESLEIRKYGGQSQISLEAGTYKIQVRVSNLVSFPSIYVDGVIESDESWEADDLTEQWGLVGTYQMFSDPTSSPEIFPFSYEKLKNVTGEKLEEGILFDFGKETFARTRIWNLGEKQVRVQFGESREEALDAKWSVVHFEKCPKDGMLNFEPYAFRYIFVSDAEAKIEAEYEYLPLEYKGAFICDEDMVNKVWNMAAYTFHLNCREFLLDGIKRDRWVWAGDAYQSLFVNRYLFFDQEIEKRTLIALGGKSPFRRHINTIMDYTFLWVISLYDYYTTYGDVAFLEQMGPQVDEVMAFCMKREDVDGFMREKNGDWIFIDWAQLDRTGALCGEQILYAKALECYSKLCSLLEKGDGGSREKSAKLQKRIIEKFYDREKKVFVDSYESGKKNVSRHSNILAYLFLPCSEKQKRDIYRRVILNDDVAQITTPYFKFFENLVHCKENDPKRLEESIRQYYGKMIKMGATTLYEEFDPNENGIEHYGMYGDPYDKSLCHAWSASPIYLLGSYRMGVQNTGIGYDRFEVRPRLGDLKSFWGKVPVPGGSVKVTLNRRELRVTADIPGGTLVMDEESYPLIPGKEMRICFEEQNRL